MPNKTQTHWLAIAGASSTVVVMISARTSVKRHFTGQDNTGQRIPMKTTSKINHSIQRAARSLSRDPL
uniref:Uncharacterized protein n=1 Tax=Anopheles aquasalis TaxID=42839 RepID=T1DQW7_ANOAQ